MPKTKEIKKDKIKLNSILIFILSVYVPFLAFVFANYDAVNISLSRIGWRMGAMPVLITFTALTVPILLCEVLFFIKRSGKGRFLVFLCILGGAFLSAAIITPFGENEKMICYLLHSVFAVLGLTSFFAATTYMFAQHCVRTKAKKYMAAIYTLFYIAVLITFFELKSSAVIEAGAAVSFICIMHLINSAFLVSPKVKVAHLKESSAESDLTQTA